MCVCLVSLLWPALPACCCLETGGARSCLLLAVWRVTLNQSFLLCCLARQAAGGQLLCSAVGGPLPCVCQAGPFRCCFQQQDGRHALGIPFHQCSRRAPSPPDRGPPSAATCGCRGFGERGACECWCCSKPQLCDHYAGGQLVAAPHAALLGGTPVYAVCKWCCS